MPLPRIPKPESGPRSTLASDTFPAPASPINEIRSVGGSPTPLAWAARRSAVPRPRRARLPRTPSRRPAHQREVRPCQPRQLHSCGRRLVWGALNPRAGAGLPDRQRRNPPAADESPALQAPEKVTFHAGQAGSLRLRSGQEPVLQKRGRGSAGNGTGTGWCGVGTPVESTGLQEPEKPAVPEAAKPAWAEGHEGRQRRLAVAC